MTSTSIGELEEIVLLTVAILNGKAYGLSLITEIEERMQRNVSLGAMQTVLKRLEDKNLVRSEFGEATNARGGKRKRLYEATSEGIEVLSKIKKQRNSLWDAIPKIALKFS